MNKFALSLIIIREITKRHPYLKKAAIKFIEDSTTNTN
jgi:hypothetical protein